MESVLMKADGTVLDRVETIEIIRAKEGGPWRREVVVIDEDGDDVVFAGVRRVYVRKGSGAERMARTDPSAFWMCVNAIYDPADGGESTAKMIEAVQAWLQDRDEAVPATLSAAEWLWIEGVLLADGDEESRSIVEKLSSQVGADVDALLSANGAGEYWSSRRKRILSGSKL